MPFSKRTLVLSTLLIILALILSGCELPGFGGPPHCSAEFLITSINDANSNGPGTDTIDLAAGCVYELGVVDNTIEGNNGTPSITSAIIINGNGATVRRSTGAQKAAIRLFHISQGGELSLNDLTLHDGMGMEPADVTITINNSGGAILNNGVLTVNNSVFDYNRAKTHGGAIFNVGTMTINNTSFLNNGVNISNVPNEAGGAIWNNGTATITNSAFVGNVASLSGGAITNASAAAMTITNSTISGNSTTLTVNDSGSAIANAGNLTIGFTTIAHNIGTSTGALYSSGPTLDIYSSIVADNPGGDCSYPPTSMILGMNINSDGSCGAMTTANPLLGPLANNGGPTLTHSIPFNSPAKDVSFGLCPATDQRGESRPFGPECDLGAYEYQGEELVGENSLISGIVFNDINADGVIDPGESPFAGVELVLASGTCDAPGTTQTALSQADGSYQFELSPPTAGSYCLSIDPLTPPNDTILIPGNFTSPAWGRLQFTLTEGEDLVDQNFGWDFQFSPGYGEAGLVITDVVLSATTIPLDSWVEVEVTVENQGITPASGYDVVLIPHYGWGPPNPGGYQAIPTLAPGASHTISFTPGVLYAHVGTFTLRVLVTDDWYSLGDPDSTGTAGDLEDLLITVEGVDLVITHMSLSATSVEINQWVTVDVTVENQGNLSASGYDAVLIPHYGVGPPNPSGLEAIPVLAPGATHSFTFTPGALYSTAGSYTVRTLVTDDWYSEGDPNSTGTAGDYHDLGITVIDPPPTDTPTPIKGSISGIVWHDENSDGIRQRTELGLSNVTVKLKTGACGTIGKNLDPITTNTKGNYTFTNLNKGTYCVSIQLPITVLPPTITHPDPPYYTVVLGTGENLSGYNFGLKPKK